MSGAASAWVLLALALVLAALVVAFATRVRRLARRVGSFECARRLPGARDWTSGIATFGAGRLRWHRLVSLSPGPVASYERRDLEVVERRPRGPDGGVVEVRCRYRGTEIELAMRTDSHAALVSWLEAAPPQERTA